MDIIIEKIINNIKKLDINIDDITTDFTTEKNIDSITFIELIISIEEEFSIVISEEHLLMEEMNTVSKIANIVKELVDESLSLSQ